MTVSLVYFSVVTQLLIMIVTGSYTIFREENSFHPFAKHCECSVFIGMLLGTHLFFKDSRLKQMNFEFQLLVAQSKLSDPRSCPLISFQELICVMKTKGHFSGNFPFVEVTVF